MFFNPTPSTHPKQAIESNGDQILSDEMEMEMKIESIGDIYSTSFVVKGSSKR